jgi:GTP-binding protein
LKLLSAEFVTSAAAGGRAEGIPHDGVPHIALAGRSNVGKSSLINALCRRKIARTSVAPGKTRLANVYRATLEAGPGGPGRWDVYLVDLPGYGYARGGTDAAVELRATAEAYFRAAATPGARGFSRASGTDRAASMSDAGLKPRAPYVAGVLLLVDARHPGLESDVGAAGWLDQMGVQRQIVATKIDKLTRGERTRNLKALEETFGTAVLPVSAASGEGLDALWQMIAAIVRDGER